MSLRLRSSRTQPIVGTEVIRSLLMLDIGEAELSRARSIRPIPSIEGSAIRAPRAGRTRDIRRVHRRYSSVGRTNVTTSCAHRELEVLNPSPAIDGEEIGDHRSSPAINDEEKGDHRSTPIVTKSVTDRGVDASFELALLAGLASVGRLRRKVVAHVRVVKLLGGHVRTRGEGGVPGLVPALAERERGPALLR